MKRKINAISLILLLLFSLSGCSLIDFFKAGGILFVNIKTEDNINPNANNIASPVVLRIYQLKDKTIFNESSFLQLYHNDEDVLKNELLSKRVITGLYPGNEKEITIPLMEGSQYIGVIVEFSNYRNAVNKGIIALYSSKGAKIDLHLDGLIMTIEQ